MCKQPESIMHVFFECLFAAEIWSMFGLSFISHFDVINIISRTINNNNFCNSFWSLLSSIILWFIQKYHNNDVLSDKDKNLTESRERLIYFDISMQITMILKEKENKFLQVLREGKATMEKAEIAQGYTSIKEKDKFEYTLREFIEQIKMDNMQKELKKKAEYDYMMLGYNFVSPDTNDEEEDKEDPP